MKPLLIAFIFFASTAFADQQAGKLFFAPIEKLPEKWWKNPDSVWAVWDKNTYYLWGANLKNHKIFDPDKDLNGGGMASSKNGPTRGRGHPHYIGIITTSLSFKENDLVFDYLEKKLRDGANLVIPVKNGRYSLGTGVAVRRHASKKNWYRSQKYLFEKIIHLFSVAQQGVFLEATHWPDCADKADPPATFPIRGAADIKKILPYLDWKMN